MARYEFSSVFADEIRNYISDRDAAGFDGEHARRSLIGFDRFCAAQGLEEPAFTMSHAIILLNETKNNRQRYVVMGDDLRKLMNAYADKCFYLLGDKDYIFTNANGGRLSKKTVYEKHREFLYRAGIPYTGDGNGPRIHDWRHHMAVYSFKQMTDSELDMYVALPILSAYLGHKTIFATEKYVRLTLQMFPYMDDKFRPAVERIFGGTADENN